MNAESKLNIISYSGNTGELSDIMEKIDANFRMLVNSEFVKGIKGDSIEMDMLLLATKDGLTNEGKSLYTAIIGDTEQVYSEAQFAKDLLGTEESYSIPVYVKKTYNGQTDEDKYKYTTPKIYHDGRLGTDEIKKANWQDLSCLYWGEAVTTTGDTTWSWTIDTSCLPTIGKDANGIACWYINHKNTGIYCQGIKGDNGEGSPMYIFRTTKDVEDSKLEIEEYWDTNTPDYISVAGTVFEENIFAFVHQVSKDVDDEVTIKDIFFGPLKAEGDTIYIDVTNTKGITSVVQSTTLAEMLNNIGNAEYSDSIPGLYVPFETGSDDKHFFKAENKSDLSITPSDENSSGTHNHNLNIDYNLKVNGETAVLPENSYLGNSLNTSYLDKIITQRVLNYICPLGTVITLGNKDLFGNQLSSPSPFIIDGDINVRFESGPIIRLSEPLQEGQIMFVKCNGQQYQYTVNNQTKTITAPNYNDYFLKGTQNITDIGIVTEISPTQNIMLDANQLPQHRHKAIDKNAEQLILPGYKAGNQNAWWFPSEYPDTDGRKGAKNGGFWNKQDIDVDKSFDLMSARTSYILYDKNSREIQSQKPIIIKNEDPDNVQVLYYIRVN